MIIDMDLYNTKWGLMLVYLSAGMAMSMFILKAGFQAVPNELSEAARLTVQALEGVRHGEPSTGQKRHGNGRRADVPRQLE